MDPWRHGAEFHMTQYQNDYTKQWHTVEPGGVIYDVRTSVQSTESFARSKATLFALKDRLIASGGVGAWTVLASSGKAGGGSLVASTGDNWSSVDDLVRASNDTTNRSWVVLQSPLNRYYMTLDYVGADDNIFNVWFSNSVPDISSPATDIRPPTTGSEWSHLSQYIFAENANEGALNMVMSRASDGSFFCGFCGPANNNLYQFFRAIYMFAVYQPNKSWDTVQAVSLVQTNLTSKLRYTDASFRSLHSDNLQVTVQPIRLSTVGNDKPLPGVAYTNPWTGGLVSTPIWLLSSDTSKKCLRGVLQDIFFGTSGMDDGTLLFKNGLVKAIKIGPFTCPMDRVSGIV